MARTLTQPAAWCLSALALAGLFAWAAEPAAKPAAAWPVFRGNTQQTGVADRPLPDELTPLWKFETKDSVEAAAAIVDGTVYVGSIDEHLYALDLETGKEKWRYHAGPFKAPPSVRDGTVYVGDTDGIFHAVDAATGKKRWTFETMAEISSGANFAGDTVLFGSGDEHLYCLTTDGKLRWKFNVPGGPVMATPTVIGDRTFVAGCDSSLHVLGTADGKELQAVELGSQTGATAAVQDDRLFVGTMGDEMLAVDWKKGAIAWQVRPGRRTQAFYSSPAVAEGLVVVGNRDRRLYALDRATGKEVWSFPTGGKVDSSPVVAGKRVYVGSADKKLYVLDLARGALVGSQELDDAITASPAVADGKLVIGTNKGTVYCFGKPSQ